MYKTSAQNNILQSW